jgi:hypothetical protein
MQTGARGGGGRGPQGQQPTSRGTVEGVGWVEIPNRSQGLSTASGQESNLGSRLQAQEKATAVWGRERSTTGWWGSRFASCALDLGVFSPHAVM